MEISPLVAHAVFLLERGQTNRRPDKQTKSQIHLDALNPPVWTNIVHGQNCCHHQSAERQRYHSEEATRTVRSRGEARRQHTSSPDTETARGYQVRAPT